MHEPIRNDLEDYLSGRLTPGRLAEFRKHTAACGPCREQVAGFEAQSAVFRSLRSSQEELAPEPGFYARVLDRIEAQRAASLWSVFLQPIFARRVLYASLALFLVVGSSVLWTSENHEVLSNDANPVGLIAGYGPHAQPALDPDAAKDAVMEDVLSDGSVHLVNVSE
jgi:anti-sigma factor RsiW